MKACQIPNRLFGRTKGIDLKAALDQHQNSAGEDALRLLLETGISHQGAWLWVRGMVTTFSACLQFLANPSMCPTQHLIPYGDLSCLGVHCTGVSDESSDTSLIKQQHTAFSLALLFLLLCLCLVRKVSQVALLLVLGLARGRKVLLIDSVV